MFQCTSRLTLFSKVNKMFGKDSLASNIVHDTTKLLPCAAEQITRTQFSYLVCGVLTPGKMLSSPKEAVADPLPKHLLFVWWSSPVQLLQVLKEYR